MLTIKNKIFKILFIAYSILVVFFNSTITYAHADTGVKPYYETSSIEEDLNEFNIDKNITYDSIKVISFIEYGFNKETDNALYSLFLYVYCPSKFSIVKQSSLNNIQIGFTTESSEVLSVNYEKLGIKFLDEIKYSTKNKEVVFSKWQINITESELLNTFMQSYKNFNDRIYCLSGVEFLLTGDLTATEFAVGDTYHMSIDEKGNTVCSRSDLKSVEVKTNHTFYRTGYSELDTSNNSGWQTQISSCYFALPKYLENKYGQLTEMSVAFDNMFLKPMLITPNEQVKNAFKKFRTMNVHSGYEYPYFYSVKHDVKRDEIEGVFPDCHTYDIYFNSTSSNLKDEDYVLYNNLSNFISDCTDTSERNYLQYLDLVFTDTKLQNQNFDDLSDYYFDKDIISNYIDEFYFKKLSNTYNTYVEYMDDNGNKVGSYVDDGLFRYFTQELGMSYGYGPTNVENTLRKNMYNRLKHDYIFETYCYQKYDYRFNFEGNEQSYKEKSLNNLGFSYNERIEQTYSISKDKTFSNAIKSLSFNMLDDKFNWDDFWGSLWKSIVSALINKRPNVSQELLPIVKIDYNDILTLSLEDISDKYFVDINEVSDLKNYVMSQSLQSKDVYLLRYDLCEYYCAPATIETAKNEKCNGLVVRQSAYLNFDVIQFKYSQDGASTIIPANHSPVNIFNAITGQQKVTYDELLDTLKIVVTLILGAILVVILWPFISPIIIGVIKLVFKGFGFIIKWVFKIAFFILLFPWNIIFKKNKRK